MLSNGKVARVTYSVPLQGYGFATTEDGEFIFFRAMRCLAFQLQGASLQLVSDRSARIPVEGTEIVVTSVIPAERGGAYPQAEGWMLKTTMEKMEAARAKAANTLAELAAEAEAENRRRKEWDAELQSRQHGSGKGGNKEKGSKKGIRQSA